MMNHVVHARFDPFNELSHPIRFEVEVGKTIGEIVEATPDLPDWFIHSGEVRINSRRVERGAWHIIRPKLGTSHRPIIITLHPSYGDPGGGRGGGGGGGSKNIFATVAAIALVAGAALISGGLLGPAAAGAAFGGLGLAGASFAAGGLGATLLAGGLSLGAALLVGTLTPPPAPLPSSPRDSGGANNQLTSAGITGNSLKPMQALPVVLGRIRTSPPFGAPPFTTLENGIVYANAVYVIAGHYDITDIMLNGVPIDEFAEVEYEVLDGDPGNASLTLSPIDTTVIERRNQNALLTNFQLAKGESSNNRLAHQDNPDQDLPQWQIFKTAGDADEVRIRLFWPALTDMNTGGSPRVAMVPIRVEIRERGTVPWLKMPVTHWQAFKLNEQVRKEIRLKWSHRGGARVNLNPDAHCIAAYYITADGQTFEYQAETYFAPASAPTDQIPVMTSATTSGVTVSASSENSGGGEQAWRACDSNPTGTRWQVANGSIVGWLKVDFGAANNKTILSYFVRTIDGGDRPYSWTLEGSNDDANWTVLSTITQFVWPDESGTGVYFQCDTSGSFRYYRINISEVEAEGEDVEIDDFQLFIVNAPSTNMGTIFPSHVNIHSDGVDFFLDPATFPIGEYEVRVKRGLGVAVADFSETAYTVAASAANANFFDYEVDEAVYKIEGTLSQSEITSDTLLESFATVSDDYPFNESIHTKGVAMIALRAPSITVESLTAIFHSIVPVWSEANDWSVDEPSNNPAALARHILLNTEQNAEALAGELIDEATFIEFFQFCQDNDHEFNGVVEGLSVIEVYRQVLAAGYAAPDWTGFWSVVWEYDRYGEDPVQVFTPLDVSGLTVSKAFPRLPQALRPIFFDEEDDFNINERELVYMDGFNEDNTTRIEETNLPGWTNINKVAERATFDLRQMYLRPIRVSFEIRLSGLACRRGDLVLLRHDVISRYHDFSRIASIQKDSGNIIGLTFESEIDLTRAQGEVEENMAAVIQFTDRTTATHQVNEQTVTNTITFTTPFPDPDDGVLDEETHLLRVGMVVGFGVVELETRRMLVLWYEYVNEFTRRITLIDEAPGLHDPINT